jgi:hypothetical protein
MRLLDLAVASLCQLADRWWRFSILCVPVGAGKVVLNATRTVIALYDDGGGVYWTGLS